jgi:hypothetical protein
MFFRELPGPFLSAKTARAVSAVSGLDLALHRASYFGVLIVVARFDLGARFKCSQSCLFRSCVRKSLESAMEPLPALIPQCKPLPQLELLYVV